MSYRNDPRRMRIALEASGLTPAQVKKEMAKFTARIERELRLTNARIARELRRGHRRGQH